MSETDNKITLNINNNVGSTAQINTVQESAGERVTYSSTPPPPAVRPPLPSNDSKGKGE